MIVRHGLTKLLQTRKVGLKRLLEGSGIRLGTDAQGQKTMPTAKDVAWQVTPLINAVSVWLQLPEARLLIADSDGHQSIRSRCAFEVQLGFLLDTASAQPVTICRD